jgi:DHA1 family inner membrane transport protein
LHDRPFPLARLLVLSAVIVLAVTTEIMPTGLLPQMSTDLRVSHSAIGLLVSSYALTVAVTCVPLSYLTRGWRRHRLLAASAAVLGLSSLAAAFAPNYGTVLATRVVGALAHAVSWSTVGAYPAHVVSKERVGSAVGVVLGGATVGSIVGVPLATSLGHSLGWRFAFAAVGGVLIVAAAASLAFLPRVQHEGSAAGPGPLPAPRPPDRTVRPALALCFLALVLMTGHYAFYTFISPYSTEVLGISSSFVSSLFLLIGIGEGIGLVIATVLFSRRTAAGMIVSLALATLSVIAIAVLGSSHFWALVAVFVWSVALGVLPVLMQTRLLQVTSAGFRDRANAVYTATFNGGIGGGALVGAIILSGAGIGALPWFYVAVLVASALLVVVMRRSERVIPVRLADEPG